MRVLLLMALLLVSAGAHAQTDPAFPSCGDVALQVAECSEQGLANHFAKAAAEAKKAASAYVCFRWDQSKTTTHNEVAWGIGTNPTCSTGFSATMTRTYPKANTCATRTKTPSGLVNSATAGTVCAAGCVYNLQDANEDWTLKDTRSNAINAKSGRYAPSGAICNAEPPKAEPKDNFCQELDGGFTQCREPGKTCLKTPTGTKHCWADGVSGPSTDKTRKEAATKSPDAPAPGIPTTPPQPRPGENWQPNGPSSSITNNTSNTTNNITNYTNTGTPNTGPGTGVPGDGSENPAGEEGDEEKGTASGGGTCEAPPSCSGDAINCAILDQSWRNRCQGGGDDNGNGQPDWLEGDAPGIDNDGNAGAGVGDTSRFGLSVGTGALDDSDLFGGGSCPAFSISVLGFEASTGDIPSWCETILPAIRAIILIFGAFTAVRILMGANE